MRLCLRRIVTGRLFRTPKEVDGHCKTRSTKVGKDSGFILDGAARIPDEAKPKKRYGDGRVGAEIRQLNAADCRDSMLTPGSAELGWRRRDV